METGDRVYLNKHDHERVLCSVVNADTYAVRLRCDCHGWIVIASRRELTYAEHVGLAPGDLVAIQSEHYGPHEVTYRVLSAPDVLDQVSVECTCHGWRSIRDKRHLIRLAPDTETE